MRLIFLFLIVFLPWNAHAQDIYQSEDYKFRLVKVADDLEHPWSLAFLPNGDMLVTEKPGRLNLIRKDGSRHEVTGLPPLKADGQGGLLDVLVHPDFAQNQTIFISYSNENGGLIDALGTEVAKARLNGTKLQDLQTIFIAEPKITFSGQHFGSRLLIGPDDKLYITLGERGRKDEAQNHSNHLGSIIRLNQDGSVPEDNPFVGREGYAPEIYTYGNRNVQGIALHPDTDQIWFHEHGPKGGDEVNILKKGANYGWPEITYGIGYTGIPITDKTSAAGMEQPVIYWDPSIAPSGMTFYTGNKFPEWQDNIFVGALVMTHLRRLELDGGRVTHQEVLLEDFGERIRDVRNGPDGYLYIVTDSSYGQVLRLEPVQGN